MAIDDIARIDTVALLSNTFFLETCEFPVTDLRRYRKRDDLLSNFPMALGHYESGSIMPHIISNALEIDTTLIDPTDECDAWVVTADALSCEKVLPGMGRLAVKGEKSRWEDLRKAICRRRGLNPSAKLGNILTQGGFINLANPYANDLVSILAGSVSQALAGLLAHNLVAGDTSSGDSWDVIDGLFTTLVNGYADAAATPNPCPTTMNTRQVVDWGALTDTVGVASPDAVVGASKTITLWGTVFNVPAGINFPEFLQDVLLEAINYNWLDDNGGGTFEVWTPHGNLNCLRNTIECMGPCSASIVADLDFLQYYRQLRPRNVLNLYPHPGQPGYQMPVLETRFVSAGTMWLAPREIGGQPSYQGFFRPLRQDWADLSPLNVEDDYKGWGYVDLETDEVYKMDRDTLRTQFEGEAIGWNVTHDNITGNCLTFSEYVNMGILAMNRGLFVEIQNIGCATYQLPNATDVITIKDGVGTQTISY